MDGVVKSGAKTGAPSDLRAGHLMRIGGYVNVAILSMWTRNPRAAVMMGMAQASLRGAGPGGEEEDLLQNLRPLVDEALDYYPEDFPAAMARMKTVQDLVSMRIVRLAGD